MDGNITSAIIAVSGVLIVGYASNFLAEDYRRFRDGSVLAASIAGELSAYSPAIPLLRNVLNQYLTQIQAGGQISFRQFEIPHDPIYDEIVGKLGLLGPRTTEDVVFTYQQIKSFRTALALIHAEHKSMSTAELLLRIQNCVVALDRASERGAPLVFRLRKRARRRYFPLAILIFKKIKRIFRRSARE